MIKDNETNKVYLAEGLKYYSEVFNSLTQALRDEHVSLELLPYTSSKKHVWARDYMPIQIAKDRFLQYSYSPDYLQDDTTYIPDYTEICKALHLDCIQTDIVLDGGNVVKCGDKVILTDKIYKENPKYEKNALIDKLEVLFQAQLVIIPWDKYEPYGHADGMVRYLKGELVLLNNYINFDPFLRKRLIKALAPHFVVEELEYNLPLSSKQTWAYINFLQTESCIFLPALGLSEDEQALEQIAQYYPKHKIVQIEGCQSLAKDGGVLNCISWNILCL